MKILDKLVFGLKIFVANVIKCGPIPRHVGIIMDGNRRYANRKNIEKTEGHTKGSDQLREAMKALFYLGIREVTFYAFSTMNFNRTKTEIEELLALIKSKIIEITEGNSVFTEIGMRLRVVGDTSLLDEDFQRVANEAMELTKHYSSTVNIAIVYTAREEITTAIKEVVKNNTMVESSDIDLGAEITRKMYVQNDVDMVIRTGGDVRLSDFLLWQSSNSILCITDVLWPEFTGWTFVTLLLRYQKSKFLKCRSD